MLALLSLFVSFLLIGFIFEYISLVGFGGIFAAVIIVGLLSNRLVYGLALIPFAYAMSPEIYLGGFPLRIEDFLIPVIFFFWFLRHLEKGEDLKPTGLYLPLLLMIASMGISTFNAFILNSEIDRVRSFLHLIKHVEYLIIFFLAFNIPKNRDDIKLLVHTTMVAAVIISAVSVTQPVTGFNFFPTTADSQGMVEGTIEQEYGRIFQGSGTVIPSETSNIFGGFLMVHLLLLLGFGLDESVNYLRKLLYFSGAFIVGMNVLITLSRSSYVGMLVGLLVLGFMTKFELLLGLFLIPFVAPAIFPTKIIRQFSSIINAFMDASLTPSWQARLEAWIHFFPEIINNPILGKGLYYVPMSFVDNEYVLRALETGITGLIILLWFIFALLRRSFQLFLHGTEDFDQQFGLGFTAALIGISVHALAATSFTTIRIAETLYFLAGILVANYLIIHDVDPANTLKELKDKQKKAKKKRMQDNRPAPILSK